MLVKLTLLLLAAAVVLAWAAMLTLAVSALFC